MAEKSVGLWAGVEGQQGLAEMSETTQPGDDQLATRRDRMNTNWVIYRSPQPPSSRSVDGAHVTA